MKSIKIQYYADGDIRIHELYMYGYSDISQYNILQFKCDNKRDTLLKVLDIYNLLLSDYDVSIYYIGCQKTIENIETEIDSLNR